MDHLAGVTELVELRSYRLVPGAAGAFVAHFEEHFLASQERLGMDIVGQFTVPGDDARFVWVRRFRDPSTRAESLDRFYGGPVWEQFGPRANELMVDHTDVHLLVPDRSRPGFATDHVPHADRSDRPGDGSDAGPGDGHDATVVLAVFELAAPGALDPAPASPGELDPAFAAPGELDPALAAPGELDPAPVGPGALDPALAGSLADAASTGGVTELGRLVTAPVANDFPRLPVHEGAPVAVWLVSDRLGGHAAMVAAGAVAAAHGLVVHTTVLAPTARSTLR